MNIRWLAGLACMVMASFAQGGVVTYTDTVTPRVADINTTLSAPLFGIGFQALDRVVISLDAEMLVGAIGQRVDGSTHTGKIVNSSRGTTKVDVTFSSLVYLNPTIDTPTPLADALPSAMLTLSTERKLTIAGTSAAAATPKFAYLSSSANHITDLVDGLTLLDSTDIAQFIGNGTFSVNVASMSGFSLLGGSNLNVDIGTYISTTLSVTYYYEDMVLGPGISNGGAFVPEPATGLLVGLGMMAQALRRRKWPI